MRSFYQWMKKKTVVRSKHKQKKKRFKSEKKQTLVSFEDGKYRWKELGKEKYQQDRLALFPNGLDVEVARDCIERACSCSWWEWLAGSRPFFWRWPPNCVVIARDGRPNYTKGDLSECLQKQNTPEAHSFKKVK